ncbi:MAG: molybdopterin-dependent oxidoreductase [Sphingomonadales bacterium]|nr:molybdopterin-dependent oxidoreductase [Sphingomonadales bacterium]
MTLRLTRRGLIGGGGALLLSGCDRLSEAPAAKSLMQRAEGLTMRSQRWLMGDALAREFAEADMSPVFRANGSTSVDDAAYRAHAAQGFARWALVVDGLVKRPLVLPLAALKAMPQRRQITRHDCVEGWSAIGQWQGPQLAQVLAMAGLLPAARYAVFHCADRIGGAPYYESIDLIDAFHPQTILAWQMNGHPLPLEHGAPLRLRVERQLGYKQAKYVMRIELVASLASLFGGKGGYWEDAGDYAWYAGI